MILQVNGDIFDTNPKEVAILQACNCQNIMGAGLAKTIKNLYPEAYAVDQKTLKGDKSKLGRFTKVKAKDDRIIYNGYTQYQLGGTRPTSYEAVARVFEEVKKDFDGTTLALPARICSVRGGADWNVILALIISIFSDASFDILIIDNSPFDSSKE